MVLTATLLTTAVFLLVWELIGIVQAAGYCCAGDRSFHCLRARCCVSPCYSLAWNLELRGEVQGDGLRYM